MDLHALKVSESAKFEDELIELRGQLQMSELHIQQVCYCMERSQRPLQYISGLYFYESGLFVIIWKFGL